MKIRKEYIILIAIVLALSLYLILRNPDRTHYQVPKLPHLAKKVISKIEISRQETSIVLHKKKNRWYIVPQGYPADTGMVKQMLDIIEKVTVTALVSESKNYSRYDLDDNKKITVRAWMGDRLIREFEVGKAAASYRHTFVKLAGNDGVYHAPGNFRANFDQTVDKLRDKIVLSFDQTEIREIRITKGQQLTVFSRKQVPAKDSAGQEADARSPLSQKVETFWQTADGKDGDETQVRRLLAPLTNLRCVKYIDDRKKEDFTNPIYTLQLKGLQEYTVSVFAKTDKDAKTCPAVSSGNDYPFLLFDRHVDGLMKIPDEVLKKPNKP